MKDTDLLQRLMDSIREWADETFGTERIPGTAAHLKKEAEELHEALEDYPCIFDYGDIREELADCQMLILNIAASVGVDAETLILDTAAKLGVNKSREWGEPNEDGSVQHIKQKK